MGREANVDVGSKRTRPMRYPAALSEVPMKRCLVTGGCGFLGSWIVRQLLDEGCEVRILAVRGEARDNVEGLDVEILEGDVRSRADAERSVNGMDTVFHAAAIYQDFAPDPTLMYDVNLRGTFNMLEASRRAGVSRVVYTASMVSIGRPAPGQTADEKTAYECWDIDFPYGRSKFFSRELAEYFAAWDQDVVVVCPGIVLGPGDIRPTPSGALIVKSFTPGPALHFDGGASYVDVRDAAAVHVLAAKKGKRGERYLATAHNLTNKEFVEAIGRAAGTSRPLLKLPLPVARTVARAMDIQARRSGKPPLLALEFFEYCLKPSYYRNDKARRELDAHFRPIEDTITDAIAYFRRRGLIAA
jgi:dihydroflavonol-4-reductase